VPTIRWTQWCTAKTCAGARRMFLHLFANIVSTFVEVCSFKRMPACRVTAMSAILLWGEEVGVKPIYYEPKEKNVWTWHIISPLSEKRGGRLSRVPHLIVPIVTAATDRVL